MIAMPTQNASRRAKPTRSRRLPRQYSTQASRNVARNSHENSHGTTHFNSVAITIGSIPLPSAPARPATIAQHNAMHPWRLPACTWLLAADCRRHRPSTPAPAVAGAAPAVEQADQHHQRRHQHDVDDLQAQAEGVDLGIELVLHVAQLLVDRQLALAKLLDLAALLGSDRARSHTLGRLQFVQPAAGVG